LKNLKQIAGENPIVIAANKIDLLPVDTSTSRLRSWVLSEVKDYCGLVSPKIAEENKREELAKFGWVRNKDKNTESGVLRQSNIHLVSCQSGIGVDALISSVVSMASDWGNKVRYLYCSLTHV
jgi:translation initiation factor IF-2